MSSVGKEANAFHGGSVNRPERLKGAYPGITRLDQLFRVNHLYIKKPLECTFLSHIVKYTLVAARRLLTDAVASLLCLPSAVAAAQASICEQTDGSEGHL